MTIIVFFVNIACDAHALQLSMNSIYGDHSKCGQGQGPGGVTSWGLPFQRRTRQVRRALAGGILYRS